MAETKRAKASFLIYENVYEKMVKHCIKNLPFEACGLLSGKDGKAQTFWPMENVNRCPVSFSMDLEQIHHTFELMDKMNEDLLGSVHSHPTGKAYPSAGDIAYNNYPELWHLIISLENPAPVVNCFQIKGNKVSTVTIAVLS